MSWIQFGGLIVSILGTFSVLWREMKTIEDKLDERIEQQSKRSDILYEMFCEETSKSNQRFYELIKETKK